MSISVHSASINSPLTGHNCYFGAFYNNFQVSPVIPCNQNALHKFTTFNSLPSHSGYSLLANNEKSQDLKWLNEIFTDDSGKNFEEEKMNIDSKKPGSASKNSNNLGNNESKSKIWRPFSPTPPSQESNVEEIRNQSKNTRIYYRNTFFSIKPSNVKIGQSKTSVFKAVIKKNSFTCTQCSSRYLSSRQLNSHMRVHTGSKPFHCEYPSCFKSFARNEELTRHKRIHSGFKPHLCTICKKRFGRKDHLSKHLKTHLQTSEKKVYQCPFSGCGHRYTRSDALTRHKSTAHAVKNKK